MNWECINMGQAGTKDGVARGATASGAGPTARTSRHHQEAKTVVFHNIVF